MDIEEIKTVKPKELNRDSLILDVRTAAEVKEKHLKLPFLNQDSTTIDVKDFIKKNNLGNSGKTLNIICKSGRRSAEVAKKFLAEGFHNVRVVLGGIEEAEKEGMV